MSFSSHPFSSSNFPHDEIESVLFTELVADEVSDFCRVNTGINMSDVTLKEAVEYLSHTDENYQQFGATFIQHTTFNEERAKQEV